MITKLKVTALASLIGAILVHSGSAAAAEVNNEFLSAYNNSSGGSIWIDHNLSGIIGWKWSNGALNAYQMLSVFAARRTDEPCPKYALNAHIALPGGDIIYAFGQSPSALFQMDRVPLPNSNAPSALCKHIYIQPIDTASVFMRENINAAFSDLRPGSIKIISGLINYSRALIGGVSGQAAVYLFAFPELATSSAGFLFLGFSGGINQGPVANTWPVDMYGNLIPAGNPGLTGPNTAPSLDRYYAGWLLSRL